MPAASVRLIAATGSMTRQVALRRHSENALSARTIQRRPEVVDRLVELQRSRQADPRSCRPRQPLARAMQAIYGKHASAPARWSCMAPRTRGRSGQRQLAREPHPRRPTHHLPVTGPSSLLAGSRRFRRRGHLVPAGHGGRTTPPRCPARRPAAAEPGWLLAACVNSEMPRSGSPPTDPVRHGCRAGWTDEPNLESVGAPITHPP
jgi:hypothetical protein